ncbi:high-energy light unresponsive protein 1-like [Centruroides vittatus]|uniref:high-energy light unresponsive protein 1-like n=1 Tax=Centruroides vittatus TaxID=120091 RepID=UPI00350ED036
MFIVICSHTLCNAMIIVLFGFTKRSKRMREIFITLWEDTGSRPDSVRIHKMESIATTQKLYCFVLYPIIAATFISSLVKFYLSIYNECIEIWDDMNVHVAYAILITITVYAVSITVISTIYFMLICDLTTERLNEIARDIEKMSSVEEVIKRLEEVMRRHQKICDLIWSMDEFFSVYIFINYLVCIPESCLLLYQFFIVKNLKEIIGLWAFGDIMNLTIISLYAASVTISVHDSSDVVHKLLRFELPRRHQMQVTLFLEKLNGPNIGLTCLDFFVVTKGVILKVFSAILTYFLLFLQFRQPESEKKSES